MSTPFNELHAQPRRSDDSEFTIKYLFGEINNGSITEKTALEYFNYGCGAYKTASNVANMSIGKINIEFNYAARAFASIIDEKTSKSDRQLAILDAFQASRHIVNDCLDIVLKEINRLIEVCGRISDTKSLNQCIDKYPEKFAFTNSVLKIVAESRRKRGQFRIDAYIKIITGDYYEKLLSFLSELQMAAQQLEKERHKEVMKSRKDLFYLVFIPMICTIYSSEIKDIIANIFKKLVSVFFN